MEIYSKIKMLDRAPPVIPRPKPMKVLVLGLSRTGTLSMYVALQKLGHNPYHFVEATKNIYNGHWQLWSKALEAKYHGKGKPFQGEDFDQILWNYDAVSDAPCCLFVDELVAAYPDAKVVLTTRTRESWLNSMQHSILPILSWRSWTLLSRLDPVFSAPYWKLFNLVGDVWCPGVPPYKKTSQGILLKSFDEHIEHVRAVVPKERLLEFHASEGWGPLCKFLDVPEPDEDFPHVNDGDAVITIHKWLYWSRWGAVVKKNAFWIGAGTAAVAAGRWWMLRRTV